MFQYLDLPCAGSFTAIDVQGRTVSKWVKCNPWNTGVFFMAEVLQYMKDMFVVVHKTGSYWCDHARKLGYAIQEASVYQHWLVRSWSISAIAAMTKEVVLSYELT